MLKVPFEADKKYTSDEFNALSSEDREKQVAYEWVTGKRTAVRNDQYRGVFHIDFMDDYSLKVEKDFRPFVETFPDIASVEMHADENKGRRSTCTNKDVVLRVVSYAKQCEAQKNAKSSKTNWLKVALAAGGMALGPLAYYYNQVQEVTQPVVKQIQAKPDSTRADTVHSFSDKRQPK